MKILEILKKPYPLEGNKKSNIIGSIIFGSFIFIFLFIFQPFGMNILELPDLLKFTGGFGIITSVYLIFHFLVIESFFKEKKWTLGKEILNTLLIVSLIGLCNYIFYLNFFPTEFKIKGLLNFQMKTLIVGIIPIVLFTFFKQNALLKKYLKEANEINKNKTNRDSHCELENVVTITAQNPKNNFSCTCNNILFLLAQDNYVIVNYVKEDKLTKEIIRTTLKQAQDDLGDYQDFYRCHKSYIVNLDKVRNVSGNAQGLKLELNYTNEIIPVSRQLHQEFTKIYCSN